MSFFIENLNIRILFVGNLKAVLIKKVILLTIDARMTRNFNPSILRLIIISREMPKFKKIRQKVRKMAG